MANGLAVSISREVLSFGNHGIPISLLSYNLHHGGLNHSWRPIAIFDQSMQPTMLGSKAKDVSCRALEPVHPEGT